MEQLKAFYATFHEAARNLLPIILVVGVFQLLVLRQIPDDWLSITIGLLIVLLGVALFLQGLELGVFPIGKNLSNEFARQGSLPLLMVFGFCLGFSAVIAEPALIAVAEQAEIVSEGQINGFVLRLLVATSVGGVVALGVVRIILGQPLHWYMIIGYITVVLVTFFSPEEIVGLAYDSGGVTTNIVTVPLIAALGLGLAAALRGRDALIHGFGLVALAVMVPMIVVQLYGIAVFTLGEPFDPGGNGDVVDPAGETEVVTPTAGSVVLGMLTELLVMFRDVLPIIAVVLFFQYGVLRRRLPNEHRLVFGFLMVIVGLYAFVVGLRMGLFPIGERMAEQLITMDTLLFVYLFAFAIGFATTMAEPALIAIGRKAQEAARGRLNANVIRVLVALGVAIGITIGVHRIISGDSIHHYVIAGYTLVIILTALSPRYIVALAFDLGGVTTSEVTVPLVTALGLGLATHIEGRTALIDGFGLIAFASIFPIVTVMLYAVLVEFAARWRQEAP